ncbi:MAG: hypothetical protein ACMUJM_21585 [bacterium]
MRNRAEEKDHTCMIDTRRIAERLGVRHSSFFRLILQYKRKFEEFGTLSIHSDNRERFALLSETQALFVRINVLKFLL